MLRVREKAFGLEHFKLIGMIVILGLHFVAPAIQSFATTARKCLKKDC